VALVESGRVVLARVHERPHSHAEELLPMLAALLREAGWSRTTLDRIGVGVGPGSFTGLRVGLALAQGIGLGLGIPVVGVGSLCAMARGWSGPAVRWPMLDARRDEVFCAAYGPDGVELVPPRAVARDAVLEEIEAASLPGERVVLGEVARELGIQAALASADTDLPHAAFTAIIAGEADPDAGPARPLYVRDPDAKQPILPPHPLASQAES
jgi:tRNA threonylcarbamoyladenosine biosynthesis protein TsaB